MEDSVGEDDDGVVGEMDDDIHEEGTTIDVEVAQQGTEEEAGQEGEDFAVGEAEEGRRDPDGGVSGEWRVESGE